VTVVILDFVGIGEQRNEESLSCKGEVCYPSPIARPYQPPIPFPQRAAWAKLFYLELKFARFLDALRRTYADTLLLEALKKAPVYLQFLRELLFKKVNYREASVVPIRDACRAILQRDSPSKVQDPGSFSIPCCIGNL